MNQFGEVYPAEIERLALLNEECNEAGQAISKILRHGFESRHPDGGPSNRNHLAKELGQVLLAIAIVIEAHDVDEEIVMAAYKEKSESIDQWLHYNAVSEDLKGWAKL